MVSKTKKNKDFDFEQREQREQYEYARSRIRQRKPVRHFIFYSRFCSFIILNEFIGLWREQLGDTWYVWAILIWLFIFWFTCWMFCASFFYGKEWEDRQLEKLKARQAEKFQSCNK